MAGASVAGNTPRTVAVDVRMVRHAGIGTYIRNVVPRVMAARPDWRFVLLAGERAPDWAPAANETRTTCASDIYTLREQLELRRQTPAGVDLFWSPHYNIPAFSRTPVVATVHDVCHLALPQMYGAGARGFYAKSMFGAVARRAREIIFVSEFSRREFAQHVREPRAATVVHNGVDPFWTTPSASAPPQSKPYLVFVGSLKPHKNLRGLLNAFAALRNTIEHDLVIVGNAQDQRTFDRHALTLAHELAPRVRIVKDAGDETLKSYMTHAAALVFPSLYEGFGLPALEAMAVGCPCIVSSAASLPEVCGDAALYCNPHDPADIGARIRQMLGDIGLQERLVAAGRKRVAQFDWDVTAGKTVAVLERALSNSSSRA